MGLRNAFAHNLSVDVPIAAAVFVVVVGVLAAALWSGRARPGRKPSSREHHSVLETIAFSLLLCMAVGLIWVNLSTNDREVRFAARPALVVDVTAYQWCWRFHYEGTPVTVTGQCEAQSFPTLALPTGRTVELRVTSSDVLHAFWVPYLRYKTYAYPDHVNAFEVDLAATGRWPGRCAVICGLYHSSMDFTLAALSPASFDRWFAARGGNARAV